MTDFVTLYFIGLAAWAVIMTVLLYTLPLAALVFSLATVVGAVVWARGGLQR